MNGVSATPVAHDSYARACGFRDAIISVRDGKIVADTADDSNWGAIGHVFESFTEWVTAAHPEDVPVMFQADDDLSHQP